MISDSEMKRLQKNASSGEFCTVKIRVVVTDFYDEKLDTVKYKFVKTKQRLIYFKSIKTGRKVEISSVGSVSIWDRNFKIGEEIEIDVHGGYWYLKLKCHCNVISWNGVLDDEKLPF